ncbi:MAG: hypothetical protein ACJAT4_001026 [Granulosicoccus sp.]|jgi:hypothetical protein
MRNLFLFIFMTLLTTIGFSQMEEITESKETMKEGTFNAIVVELLNADDKVALNVWKSFIKGYGAKAKKVKKSKEYLASGAIIGGLNNSENVDVYAKVQEKGDDSELIVWIQMGEFYVSSGSFPSDYTAAVKMLEGYVIEVAKELVNNDIEDEEKKMKRMEKEMDKLKKKNTGYHRDIEKAKDTIARAEGNIEENERAQKEQTSIIESQQKALQALKEKLSEM